MKGVKPHTVGLALGTFMALWHAFWAFLVAMGMAKPLLDWVFGLHFMVNPYMMVSFDMMTALVLILFTFFVGYVAGWVIGHLWNWSMKKK